MIRFQNRKKLFHSKRAKLLPIRKAAALQREERAKQTASAICITEAVCINDNPDSSMSISIPSGLEAFEHEPDDATMINCDQLDAGNKLFTNDNNNTINFLI